MLALSQEPKENPDEELRKEKLELQQQALRCQKRPKKMHNKSSHLLDGFEVD